MSDKFLASKTPLPYRGLQDFKRIEEYTFSKWRIPALIWWSLITLLSAGLVFTALRAYERGVMIFFHIDMKLIATSEEVPIRHDIWNVELIQPVGYLAFAICIWALTKTLRALLFPRVITIHSLPPDTVT